jgi:hypothetical protein
LSRTSPTDNEFGRVKPERRKISNRKEFISGSFLFAVGLFVFVQSLRLPIWSMTGPQEGFFPLMVAVIMIGVSLTLIYKTFGLTEARGKNILSEMGGREKSNIFRLLSYAILMLLLSLFLEKVGFLASGMLFLIMILKFVEKHSWKTTLWIACISILLSYLIFVNFLGVPLPRTIPRLL